MARRRTPTDVAVIGLGGFGQSVAVRLERMGLAVLGIDKEASKVKAVLEDITQAMVLDATSEEAMSQADIASFQTAVVALGDNFEASVLATAHLRSKGVQQIIAQAGSAIHRDVLLRIGATQVVIPEEDSGQRLAETLAGTADIDRLRLAGDRSLAGLPIPERFVGETVEVCEQAGVTLVMIRHGDDLILGLAPDQRVEAGDVVYVVGDESSLARFSRQG